MLRLYAPGGKALADQLGAPRRVPFLQLVHALERAANAVRTADFFQIPPSRVVELGAQVAF